MKKVRGKKRKLKMIEQRLSAATGSFPETFYNNMYVWKLPASQSFIEGLKPKESAVITRSLESCTASLIEKKPNETFKVVTLIFPEDMWNSQIIIFENSEIQIDFFNGHLAKGHWIEQHMTDERLHSHWVIRQFTDGGKIITCYIERWMER